MAALAVALGLAPGPAALGQPGKSPLPAPGAAGVKASKDPAAAPSGVYLLDPDQTSVTIRVLHAGLSYSVLRLTDVSGALNWSAAKPEAAKVNVKIGLRAIQTPAAGLADTLDGPQFLNAGQYPDAVFVSTAIRRTGPAAGEVSGDLTLHGVTRPLILAVDLIGAGQALGGPILGFHGEGSIRRSDFHIGPATPLIGDEVQVVLDLEFKKAN